MAELAATSLPHHHQQQQQNLQQSHHFNHICGGSNGVREMCEKSRAALDSLKKQLFLICGKEEKEATAPPPPPHHDQILRPPYRLINFTWDSNECGDACEKSKDALNDFNPLSITLQPHLMNDLSDKNLFLIHIETGKTIQYVSYSREGHDWGNTDIMANLRDETTPEQRMNYLKYAANFRGGAVHLLRLKVLTPEEQSAWLDAVSLAAQRDAAPKSLLISKCDLDIYHVLSALKKIKGLEHLSLQWMTIHDQCIEVLRNFSSLTSLHLEGIDVSDEFVANLADLHPSHSPLAASLQRLHIDSISIDWGRSSGFLRHWSKLQELSLLHVYEKATESELMEFLEHLAPSTKEVETAGNTPPASPPQLYSLELVMNRGYLSRSATAAVVDALSRSGLPFFSLDGLTDPAIEAQLQRNQRNFMWGLDSTRVPATSMRLFICGDPFAGKTTLASTMSSMYGTRKRDKFMRSLFATQGRTRGIEVGAIQREGIRVSVWDMAGQLEFHAFHDCMFPDIGTGSYQLPSMFMFVWSPMDSRNSEKGAVKNERNFEASFRYWLRFLASKSKQSNIALRVMVVFTRSDQMVSVSSALSPLIDSLRSDFKGVIDILDPPFHVDARKKDSVKPVAENIFVIAKDMLQGIQVYNISTQIHKRLSKHSKSTNEVIITWEKFSEICYPFHFPNDNAKLKAIALCLNESGNIIYINGISHIILNPNWFCNQVMGSIIDFSNSQTSKSTIVFTNGCIPRNSLEECLESVAGCKVKGVLLVDLMEAMHLCCKVNSNHGVPNSNVDHIFIPALSTDGSSLEQLQWRSLVCTPNVDDGTFVHMGRRLQCEDQNLTFLTPGLFPRIQVLFNNVFQSIKEDNVDIKLGKDFIYICFPDKEIIIMFCKAKSEHVIDVLVRAYQLTNNQQCHMATTLAYVEKHVINTLITICAQPTGIQGVKLIESVIRPDCLHYPSRAQEREDQCVEIAYLKQQLRKKLERGEPKSYDWKQTYTQMRGHLKNDFIDLLGSENYEEVLMSCKAWLKEEAENPLLYSNNDEVDVTSEQQSQQNMTTESLENNLLQHLEDQTLEVATDVEVRTIKVMAKAMSILYHVIDANHKELLDKMDAMHHELQHLREDIITKVEQSVCKLLKLTMENKAKKQLPCVAILTTNGRDKNVGNLVTSLLGALSVQIHLYCEHAPLPHPVENQPGITLTSWSESRAESIQKVLPYINFFFSVLTIAIKLGINSMAPLASSFVPDWTPHLNLAKEHPMMSSIIKSKLHRSTASKISHTCPSTSEYFKEWQNCLAFILEDNGGSTDQNIADKFYLWRANTDGGNQVSWLCKRHYEEQMPFSLS